MSRMVDRQLDPPDGIHKEEEEKLAVILAKAGLQQHFNAFKREKVSLIAI